MLYVEEQPRSELYVLDLVKSRAGSVKPGHKYLRRYPAGNGTWRYVYEEPGGQGRQELATEVVDALKELGEMGNRRARFLFAHLEERTPKSGDPLDQPLWGTMRQQAVDMLKTAVAETLRGVEGAGTGGPFGSAYQRAGLRYVELQQQATRGDTLRELLGSVEQVAEKLDRTFTGLAPGTSQNQPVREAGGYGNALFQMALARLESSTVGEGRLPQLYARYHRRGDPLTPVARFRSPEGRRELEARVMERQRQARERALTAQREQLRAYEGTVTHAIATQSEQPLDVETLNQLDATLKRMLGNQRLAAADFPYNDFVGTDVKTQIVHVRVNANSIDFELRATKADGTPVSSGWRRQWNLRNGSLYIYNSYLAVDPAQRGASSRLGELVNEAQFRFLKKYAPEHGAVGVTAALDVGGYNWANTGFSFQEPHTLREMRTSFRTFLAGYGINLSEQDMALFKEPCHFSAFNDGKKYLLDGRSRLKLTDQQKETKSLSGKAGEFPLTSAEEQSGQTTRMAVHLGKKFLLGRGWGGIVEAARMNETNEAWRFYQHYREKREAAWKVLNSPYRQLIERTRAAPGRAVTPPTRAGQTAGAGTPGTTVPAGTYTLSSAAARRSRTGRRIAAVRRPSAFGSWPVARQRDWWHTNNREMSGAARNTARAIMQGRERQVSRDRREFAERFATVWRSAPDGLAEGNPVTVTGQRLTDEVRQAQDWNRLAYNAIRALPNPEEEVRQRYYAVLNDIVNDHVYRLRHPQWNMGMHERASAA